jgi:O-antigen/teichoic acid export membrane protein
VTDRDAGGPPRDPRRAAGPEPDRERELAAAQATAEAAPADVLDAGEVRRRAVSGAAALGMRNVVLLVAGLVANLVLARLLTPRDFGLVALGQTLILLGGYLSSGGIGVALVGRPEPPTLRELQSVFGIQLAAATALAAAFALAAIPFGRNGAVVALMLATLPLSTLRIPQAIALERELSFRTIATVDVIELLAQYTFALAAVAAGAGVWGLAASVVVRGIAGAIAMVLLSDLGWVRPRLAWTQARPLLGFGVRFQAVAGVGIARDQALNAGIAAIAGIATLGVWALAFRVMQVPLMLFTTLYRVSYPAMAKLLAAGRDPGPAIERGVALTGIAIAVIVVGIVAGAPALIPVLLGDRWDDVPAILGLGGIALMITCPISAATVGWLYAAGDPTTVLKAFAAHAALWLAVGLALLEPVGPAAIGIGWIAGALGDATVLAHAAATRAGARVVRRLALPLGAALAAGAAGWAISSTAETVPAGLAGLAAGEALLLATLFLLAGPLMREASALAREGLRGARE